MCVADPTVELHHLAVDVDTRGRVAVVQLAGRAPCRFFAAGDWDREPAAPGPDGRFAPGTVCVLGASRLRFCTASCAAPLAPSLEAPANDPWRRAVQRAPRVLPRWDPEPIAAPSADHAPAPGGGAGLLAAVCSIAGGAVVAVVMRNPMFLLFGAVGFATAIATRLAAALSRRRRERGRRGAASHDRERFVAALAAQRAARLAHHRLVAPLVGDAIAAVSTGDRLWARRAAHGDAFTATIGWGEVRWEPRLDGGQRLERLDGVIDAAARFADAPVVADLGPGAATAITGPGARGVARSLLTQLAAFTGPADWRLVVVTDRAADWTWTRWLPHTAAVVAGDDAEAFGDDLDAALCRLDDGEHRHVVVCTDRTDLLANRTGALRRFLAGRPADAGAAAVLAVVASDGALPSMCRSALALGSLGRGRWCPDVAGGPVAVELHAAGLTLTTADATARGLAPLQDPEDPAQAAGALPATVGIDALLRRVDEIAVDDPIAIAAAWRADRAEGRPVAVIGATGDGVVEVDLVRDGPHALVAGTTGAGKSELLRTLVAGLAARRSPDDLNFVLVDYKGGATFDACAELPHTVGLVTDLDEHLAARALASLEAELRRRERILREAGAESLQELRDQRDVGDAGVTRLARLVVVIDEFAALAAELPSFLASLVGIAQRGRSLGVHLVLATQRPAGVVSDEIRANTNLRIALRLNDRTDAIDVVGEATPARIARGTPGRAVLRLGPAESLLFQAATSSDAHHRAGGAVRVIGRRNEAAAVATTETADSVLTVLTRSIRAAASLCELGPPTRPWLEPLPAELDAAGVAALLGGEPADGTVGLIDDPGGQRRVPLRWERGTGNLALVGSLGSGTSTALRAVVAAAAGTAGAQIYLVDARGDGGLTELAAAPGCRGVVALDDGERRARLLGHLAGEVAARRAAGARCTRSPIVLAVDGLGAMVQAVSPHGRLTPPAATVAQEHDALVRIATDGVAVGVHVVATMERAGAVPAALLSAFAQRWVFRLDDPADAGALGLRPADLPSPLPGRCVLAASRLEAQVARPATADACRGGVVVEPAAPLAVLPADVDGHELPVFAAPDAATTAVAVGIDFATLEPAAMELPDGEHALVLGPARSGRSTALVTLAHAWIRARPDGAVLVHTPRPRSPLATWAAEHGADVTSAAEGELVEHAEEAATGGRSCLLVIDDAERVADAAGGLADLVADRDGRVTVVAAARPDAIRTMYGHWTAVVRRSRLGLVLAASADGDGELLGEPLPRSLPIPARRGLAWLIDGNGRRLVQLGTVGRQAASGTVGRQAASGTVHAP